MGYSSSNMAAGGIGELIFSARQSETEGVCHLNCKSGSAILTSEASGKSWEAANVLVLACAVDKLSPVLYCMRLCLFWSPFLWCLWRIAEENVFSACWQVIQLAVTTASPVRLVASWVYTTSEAYFEIKEQKYSFLSLLVTFNVLFYMTTMRLIKLIFFLTH